MVCTRTCLDFAISTRQGINQPCLGGIFFTIRDQYDDITRSLLPIKVHAVANPPDAGTVFQVTRLSSVRICVIRVVRSVVSWAHCVKLYTEKITSRSVTGRLRTNSSAIFRHFHTRRQDIAGPILPLTSIQSTYRSPHHRERSSLPWGRARGKDQAGQRQQPKNKREVAEPVLRSY